MSEHPTVTVTAIQKHTYDGGEYDIDDTYEIDATLVESIVAQGKAVVTDPPKPAPAKPSQPVESMSTANTAALGPKP